MSKRTMKNKLIIIRNNEKFGNMLGELEDIMNRQGNLFQARAYKKAQETIMEMNEELLSVKQLENKPGIGKSIIDKYKEYLKTGKLELLEKEKNNPVNVLTNVYGIGPKKAKQLIDNDNITTIEQLNNNKDKLNDKQLIGLNYYYDILERIPRAEIVNYKKVFDKVFEETKEPDAQYEIVGSFRRGATTSGDIDIIVNDEMTFNNFINELIKRNLVIEMLTDGKVKKLTIAQLPGKKARRIDFLYSPKKEYAFAVLYFTGSKAFNVAMRRRATDMDLTLNEHGLSEFKGKVKGNILNNTFPTEKSIFDFLNLEFKTPIERKDARDIIIKTPEVEAKAPSETETKAPPETETKAPPEVKTKAPPEVKTKAPPDTETKVPSEAKAKVKSKKTKTKKLKIVHKKEPKIEPEIEPKIETEYTKILYKIDNKDKLRQWRVWVEGNKIYTEHGVVDGKLIKSKPTELKDNDKAVKRASKLWDDKKNKELYSLDASKSVVSFRPMLAKSFDKEKNKNYPYACQPKLDGVRCIAYREGDTIKLETRTGKQIGVLNHIKEALKKYNIPENLKLDGELGSFGMNPKLTFQQATGIINSKTENPEEENIEYHLYDVYDTENVETIFKNRWTLLNKVIKSPDIPIQITELIQVNNLDELEKAHEEYVKQGYEGLIIRTIDGVYQPDHRSSSLLKYKSFLDDEFVITNYKEGKGNDKNTVIFTCKTTDGKTFEVRPKGTREYRAEMLKDADKYIGKTMTVKYFEFTNDGIPRFPVGISIRDYE